MLIGGIINITCLQVTFHFLFSPSVYVGIHQLHF